MLHPRLLALTLTVGLAACTKDDSTVRSEPGVAEPAPATAQPAGGGASGGVAAASATPAPVAAEGGAVITTRTGFYKTASKDSKVPDPSGKGQVSNWISLLQRGDAVSVLKTEGEWSEVEVTGGARGFVPANTVLTGTPVVAATTLEAIVLFDRPDPVAVTKARLEPGSLVFVLSKKERFAEINVRQGRSAWVLADQLDSTPDEVQVARMIEKTRYLQEKEKGQGTPELLEVATATFPAAKLLPALRALITGPTATATAAAAAPAAAPAP